MDAEDYRREASLFFEKVADKRRKALVFRRFPQAAEAIRYAIEELSPHALGACSLEVNDMHYFGRDIRPLYESADFPLTRSAAPKETDAPGPHPTGRKAPR